MSKPLFNRLALIGVGLIGSSIARAARAQNAASSIVATAPKLTVLASEDDLRAFLHTLPDAVLRDLAGKGIEDIAWKPTP